MDILSFIFLIDSKIQDIILNIRSNFWDNLFLFFTNLGEWRVITLIFIILSYIFYHQNKKNLITPLFTSVLGSGIMTVITKLLVDRTRPNIDYALYFEKGASFPSAHAALIFSLCGFLIYYTWRLRSSVMFKIFIISILSLVIVLIGFSRLYLGVHFLSDVLAGYLVGLLWVFIAIHIYPKKV